MSAAGDVGRGRLARHGNLATADAQVVVVEAIAAAAAAASSVAVAARPEARERGASSVQGEGGSLGARRRRAAGPVVHGPHVVLDGLGGGLASALLEEDESDGRQEEEEARAGARADSCLGACGEAGGVAEWGAGHARAGVAGRAGSYCAC